MSFRDAFNRRRTPGYAGGTLEEQLLRDAVLQGQEPQVLTPQSQQAITRPRTVAGHPLEAQPPRPAGIPANAHFDPNAYGGEWIAPDDGAPMPGQPSFKSRFAQQPQQENFGSSGEQFGSARLRRTQPRDVIADDSQYLRDLQIQPRGKKGKIMDVIDAVNAGFGNKPRVTMTKRERQMAEAQDRLNTELTVGQKQTAIQQGQMVPVTLEDGTVVNVPARGAGTLQSQQQRIRQQNAESERRREMDKNRVAHWSNMDAASRKRLIAGLYGSGALNSPGLLEYAADELGVPGTLREKFISGQMRDAIDENGNLIQVNRQNQTVLPVGVKSYETTKEAGRNRRFAEGQAGATARAGMRGTGTGAGRKLTAGERTDIAETAALVRQTHRQLTEVDAQINAINAKGANASAEEKATLGTLQTQRKKLVASGALQADKLNQLDPENEWGSGTGGYPYSKPKPRQAASDLDQPIYGKPKTGGRTIEGAVKAFTKRLGREPTADEIARMKAALGQ